MVRKKYSMRRPITSLPPAKVYITASAVDGHDYAKALAEILDSSGAKVTWSIAYAPQGTPQEQLASWVDRVLDEIPESDVVIIVGTPAMLQSEWVEQELGFAVQEFPERVVAIMFRDIVERSDIPEFLMDVNWALESKDALRNGPSMVMMRMLHEVLEGLETGRATRPKGRAATFGHGKRQLNEGKLILVGRGEVGKTSLVRRLTQGEFSGDESKTQGINITSWLLGDDAEPVRLNVWDFGGQEIMHATHQFFLTERSLYVLVLNGRGGGEDVDAEYWLKHIASFGGESPVIVVQNKIAQHPFELNYRGLQAGFPSIRAFVKTDCKESIGLDELQRCIHQTVNEMPEVRMPFPADWFRVKQRLESMDKDFMGYEDFRRLCEIEGIVDESDRTMLSWVLHCLGIALNYREDSRLRETSVLKPEWVTEGIYRILNARTVAEVHGELHLDDLKQLLSAQRYPLVKHHFLLELMRKFSLCFAFPDRPDRYLVPELLGKEEPEETVEFPPKDCLNFEYHYGVLPEGLIPRFIVRCHPLSRNQKRWRSGVILAHEGCVALVTAKSSDRKVIVRVKGEDSGSRRRLLAIVRYDLDRINSEFRDRLDAQQKVPLSDSPEFCVDYDKLVAFEKQGVKTFPEYTGQGVVTVNVDDLLNGVDLESQRDEALDSLAKAKSVFFSYSHKDESLRDELETHLKLLQRQGVVSAWHDRKILPGQEWDGEIDRHLTRAKIVLLLVSADFIASEYCWDKEVQTAMARHESGEAIVIPIMLRPCDWKDAPFAKLQGLPQEMKAITSWEDRDAAWTDVAVGIRRSADRF